MARRLAVSSLLCAASMLLSACHGLSAALKGSRRTEIDVLEREVARREVYATVLREMYRDADARRFVVDPTRTGADWIVGQDLRTRVPGLRSDTATDYERSSRPGPMPRDLDAGLPIDWLGAAEFSALATVGPGSENSATNRRWEEFHRRFPGSSGWIAFSEVGFSVDGRQALVHVRGSRASLDGAGYLVLLERTTDVWRVRRRVGTTVS